MKLSPRDAVGYFARPNPPKPGLLIYGQDAMRVALKRQDVVAAMLGPDGEAEMRLVRHPAADVRKDPALLADGLKEIGFFPGQRVVLLDDATDAVTAAVTSALDEWSEGDACIVLTAGALTPRSTLRKLFEARADTYAAAVYEDPPSRAEIEAALRAAGLMDIPREAMTDIEALSRSLDPGDFRQTMEKLALFKLGDAAPLSPADVAAVAPTSTEADVDEVIDVVAEARTRDIGPALRRLEAQGATPVGLCIAAARHFRTLYAVASDPEGPERGAGRLRPPLNFKRRDGVIRQAKLWGPRKLEDALHLITDTDLALRSSAKAPQMAVMERTFVRLSMLAQR